MNFEVYEKSLIMSSNIDSKKVILPFNYEKLLKPEAIKDCGIFSYFVF